MSIQRVVRFVSRRPVVMAFLVLAGGMFGTMAFTSTASAGICWKTISCDTGWFSGRGPDSTGEYPADYWDVIDGGLHSPNLGAFLSDMSGFLKCTSTDQPGSALGVAQSDNNATGAAFIILTMLGAPAKTPKNQACVRWTEWKTIVTQYDKAGLVNYNFNLNPVNVNTFFTHSFNGDVGFDKNAPAGLAIVFFNPDGSGAVYAIRHECGNPVGVVNPLPSVTKPPTGDVNPPTPQTGTNPPGYTPGDSDVNSSCQTISGHAFDPNQPTYGVPVTVTYSIGGAPNGTATASTSGSHLWTVDTPAAVRSSTVQVTVSVTGKAFDGTTYTLTNSPIKIGPCLLPNPVCDGFTVSPASIDPGTPYTITARVNYNNDAIRTAVELFGGKFFVTIQGPGVNRTLSDVKPFNHYGVGGISVTTPQQPATGQSGSYTIGWGITGFFGAINCGAAIPGNPNPPDFPVTNKPYFEVDGGDISAGAGMSTGGADCAVASNTNAGIVSWNRGSAGGYGGAGTQFAALALGHLQDFATGQGSGYVPSGLAFANTSDAGINVAGGLFGGNFDGIDCSADYFANANNIQTGNITLGAQSIPNGEHRTIYVDGNVYITGNITFSGSYALASDVPSFSLVVKGNIYIAPGVTQLDGFYIAQASSGSATNGVIYTCASAPFTAAPLNRNLQNTCSTALTVNGSFNARQVWLLRTAGTLSTTPAEKFNYVPELWLSAPFDNGLGGTSGDYDSITSLPPVL